MKAHIIEGGVVVNTIEVDSFDFMPNLVEATVGGIGWHYANGVFTDPNAESEEEVYAKTALSVRTKRNILLADSDWTQIADAPVDATAWATYRQALRDITSQQGFPHEVTWPTKPE